VAFPKPESDEYDDVGSRQVELSVTGGTMSVLVYECLDGRPRPAIVIGAEGGGINHFIKRIAATLAHVGFVALVPDYYRGVTIADPDTFSDAMIEMINALDFRRAAIDFLDTIAFARELPNVDGKVAVWGYCTGGTIAMFGVCLDRNLDAADLFYPSQPRFDVIDAKRPVNVIDLVWNIACPVLLAHGDQDNVMPPEQLAQLGDRLREWGVPHEMKIYPGVGHAFSSEGYVNYGARASEAAWNDGLQFLVDHMGTGQ
jgi:carboxymethylenebutenolidase